MTDDALWESIMHTVKLKEAAGRLAELINEVASGEEVVITRDDGATFKIIPVVPITPSPKFGSAKGRVNMTEDFDEPLEDFQAYAP
jgi:antitoxin (DNA-binding transcriptional repressor) of toxin-antitoxin stability system